MSPLAPSYESLLEESSVRPQSPETTCNMFSSVFGRKLVSAETKSGYWRDNMTSTVQFSKALEKCIHAYPAATNIIEIGPHPALKGPVTEILKHINRSDVQYLHTCSRGENDFTSLLQNIGTLLANGTHMNLAMINAVTKEDGSGKPRYIYGNVLTDLPRYQWSHSTGFWSESNLSRRVRFREFPRHQLLGSRLLDDVPIRPGWCNHLLLSEIPWLADLKVGFQSRYHA